MEALYAGWRQGGLWPLCEGNLGAGAMRAGMEARPYGGTNEGAGEDWRVIGIAPTGERAKEGGRNGKSGAGAPLL